MEEEVGSSEVGSSGKASLSEKVVLVLLAVEAGAVKDGSGFLPSGGFSVVPSRRVPSRRVSSRRVLSRRVPSRRAPSRWVQDLAIKAGAGARRPGLGIASYPTGRSGLGSLRA